MKTVKLVILIFVIFSVNQLFAKENPPVKDKTIKVALLLDTSNSMDGLINQAKAQLWEIVNELSYAKCGNDKPKLQIALYEYGNDGLSSESGYIRRVLRFSSDLDDISEKLFGLRTNGGSEFCGAVIKTSLEELEWGRGKDDLKMIFIAGNEDFTQGKVNYIESIAKAKEKDVVVNTIFCGNYENGIRGMWQDGARKGNGDYMNINQNKQIVAVVTPYDDKIIILNQQLNTTYIYYGSHGRQKFKKQRMQDSNANIMSKSAEVSRTVSKSSRIYSNASWDLVDAQKEKSFSYKNLEKKRLPKELQNKSDKEIKQYTAKKSKERSEIQAKIQKLNKKRRDYISKNENTSSKKDELNSAVINAIKKQAKKKNYTW